MFILKNSKTLKWGFISIAFLILVIGLTQIEFIPNYLVTDLKEEQLVVKEGETYIHSMDMELLIENDLLEVIDLEKHTTYKMKYVFDLFSKTKGKVETIEIYKE